MLKILQIIVISAALLVGSVTSFAADEPCLEPKAECLENVREAAKRGDAIAQNNLGIIYGKGISFAPDEQGAVRWFRKAAEQGNTDAQFNLGLMYIEGKGVAKDEKEAVRWFRAAADQGHVRSQFNLGLMYDKGTGVEWDDRVAFRWYRKAAEQNHVAAQFILGEEYSNGLVVEKDNRKAFRWYRKAAERGYAEAQYFVGVAYIIGGLGIVQDEPEGFRWMSKSAEQGSAKAQYFLGKMYQRGLSIVERDNREALRWYQESAEQGHADAQYSLGEMYQEGKGVRKDGHKAFSLYRKASEQGHADAQSRLILMFYNGGTILQDRRKAHVWALIAIDNGVARTVPQLLTMKYRLDRDSTSLQIRGVKSSAARLSDKIEKKKSAKISNKELAKKDSGEFAVAKPPKDDDINSLVKKDGGEFSVAKKSPKQNTIAAEVFENAWRSIVMIKDGVGHGSGVIVRPNLVATNCHVVDSGIISVYKPEDKRINETVPFSAKVVHRNQSHDFCILEVKGLWGIPATIRKYDTLKIGENVYALGAPLGLDMSLSEGLISQLRKIDKVRFIQTDAAISPGSSGGGLFDVDGNLVGMPTQKYAGEAAEGLGLAIPADLVLEF